MNFKIIVLLLPLLCFTSTPFAENSNSDDFSMMQELSDRGLHDLNDENWSLYGQSTYISNFKDKFSAAYTNLNGSTNSLSPSNEHAFTATLTAFLGIKVWQGGEFYAVPELISLRPLSGLKGLGSTIQNFELQKNGAMTPLLYLSRAFYRQTVSFGGASSQVASAPMQLGGMQSSRRFVFTAGDLSILDIFDRNSFAADLRQQFVNMAFMTHAAYDFAADARGYSIGLAGELYWDDWAFRFGRFLTPKNPNELKLDYGLKYYGDQIELEHKHSILGQDGAVKLLAYRNHEQMGRWDDAMMAYQLNPNQNATTCTRFNYESENSSAPDLCWARKANTKMGIGINAEQQVADDVGVFFRAMYADGKTEVYSYTSADRSISIGGIVKGNRWNRSKDAIGVGFQQGWISKQHAQFLNMGGIDGFIGDGKIHQAPERVAEIYYKIHAFTSTWLTLDYQRIMNSAYNADRGDVDVYSVRAHFEF